MAEWKRKSKLYTPNQPEPFKLSRSKIELFVECPRCFFLDRRLGIARPSLPGFSLNSAVDFLLKKEFDLLREKGEAHELMNRYKIDAIPFSHPRMDEWRTNFTGQHYLEPETNLFIFGAVDDVWENKDKGLLIVDYKSTSTDKMISLEDEYKQSYKRQMEVYQWLFRNNGFTVSSTGYFVFANAGKTKPRFDGVLEFDLSIIPYTGEDSWIIPTLRKIKDCLDGGVLPLPSESCEHCVFREAKIVGVKEEIKFREPEPLRMDF